MHVKYPKYKYREFCTENLKEDTFSPDFENCLFFLTLTGKEHKPT